MGSKYWKWFRLILYVIIMFAYVYLIYTQLYMGPYLTTLIVLFVLLPNVWILYKVIKTPEKLSLRERLSKLTLVEKTSFILAIGVLVIIFLILLFNKEFKYTTVLFLICYILLSKPFVKLYKLRFQNKD